MGLRKLVPYSTHNFDETTVVQEVKGQRLASERVSLAQHIYEEGELIFPVLEKRLNNLIQWLEVSGGALFLCTEKDHLIAECGKIKPVIPVSKQQETKLFSGSPVIEKKRYIHPIQSGGLVVGFVYLATDKDCKLSRIQELVQAYVLLMQQELEPGNIKASLDIFPDESDDSDVRQERIQQFNQNILRITTHDLSSPLNAVAGYLDMIDDCISNDEGLDKIQNYYRRIQSGVQDVTDMLSQLEEVAKIERGTIAIKSVKVDLNWLVTEVSDLLDGTAGRKEITLAVKQTQSPVYVKADIVKFKRVIINLISNAIKYSEKGSRVDIEIEEVDSLAKVHVKDRGIGISQENLDLVFEPFVMLEKVDNTESQGLGLFISSYFMQMMNGAVYVDSEPGTGSRFTVEIPLMDTE